MARDNQGLQIALIVFVMLSLILGVTTFLFFRQYQEANLKEQAAQQEASQKTQALTAKTDECNQLKKWMGFSEQQALPEIDKEFQKDMQAFANGFADEDKVYHRVVPKLFKACQDKDAQLVAATEALQKQKNDHDLALNQEQQQKSEFQKAREAADKQLLTTTQTADKDRATIQAKQKELQDQLQEAQAKAKTDIETVETDRNKANEELVKLDSLLKQRDEKIRLLVRESSDSPQGEIIWVDQKSRMVWINLGRSDALRRQTTFSVYPVDLTNLAKATAKASIEVTQVLGEHFSEARIIDEKKVSDPIIPGDKIFTPIWSPGEQKHYALAGYMDVDGDGSSDRDLIRNLITMNGGVIDCELDDKKPDLRGKLDFHIRYLVLGEPPTVKGGSGSDSDMKSQKEMAEAFGQMVKEADRLGIQKISMAELLQQVGWKRPTSVVQFGRGANPKDFTAKAPPGVQRVSAGSVSEVFQPRRPPNKRGTAY